MCELAQSQWNLCLLFLYVGVTMGGVYDLIRCVRRVINHNNVIIAIEDLIYWSFVSIYVLYKVQKYAYGNIRFFMFLAVIFGILTYWATISSTLVKPLFYMLCRVKKCVQKRNNLLKKRIKKCKIKISIWMKDGIDNEKEFRKKKEIN